MMVIAVFNQKGGVGKTTTALNLLAAIARRGQRPLGIDLDPQAHLSHVFGAHPKLADDSVYSFFVRPVARASLLRLPVVTRRWRGGARAERARTGVQAPAAAPLRADALRHPAADERRCRGPARGIAPRRRDLRHADPREREAGRK